MSGENQKDTSWTIRFSHGNWDRQKPMNPCTAGIDGFRVSWGLVFGSWDSHQLAAAVIKTSLHCRFKGWGFGGTCHLLVVFCSCWLHDLVLRRWITPWFVDSIKRPCWCVTRILCRRLVSHSWSTCRIKFLWVEVGVAASSNCFLNVFLNIAGAFPCTYLRTNSFDCQEPETWEVKIWGQGLKDTFRRDLN